MKGVALETFLASKRRAKAIATNLMGYVDLCESDKTIVKTALEQFALQDEAKQNCLVVGFSTSR